MIDGGIKPPPDTRLSRNPAGLARAPRTLIERPPGIGTERQPNRRLAIRPVSSTRVDGSARPSPRAGVIMRIGQRNFNRIGKRIFIAYQSMSSEVFIMILNQVMAGASGGVPKALFVTGNRRRPCSSTPWNTESRTDNIYAR